MSLTHALKTLTITLALGLALAGCRSDARDRAGSTQAGVASPQASPGPVDGPAVPPPAPGDGIVAQLTGDDDSEVSPEVEQIVFAAVMRDADDAPLEGF